MAAPSDRNARIALANGWKRQGASVIELNPPGEINFACIDHWVDAEGNPHLDAPDFVGTLEGVSGMLRELYEATDRVLEVLLMPFNDGVQCILDTVSSGERYFWAPWERWGDCVGDAWLIVKEAVNGSSE